MQTSEPKESKVVLKLREFNKFLVCDIKKKECELLDLEEEEETAHEFNIPPYKLACREGN